ncbi:MAG: hypothetical protein SO293_09000 [Alloprevotella sp.]|nr:hypothetical protein [Alloprevotella sp.]
MALEDFDWEAYELATPLKQTDEPINIEKQSEDYKCASNPVECPDERITTNIGYFHSFTEHCNLGIIIDSKKNAHCFTPDPACDYKYRDFFTFEGDSTFVSNVIPLCNYPRFQRFQQGKAMYLQDGCGSWYKFFLVDRYGKRYSLDGAEAFIVGKLFSKQHLKPLPIESISEEDFSVKVKEITQVVEYVSTHIQEIADSYQVTIVVTHRSKIGGDDTFYSDRVVNLLYEDSYIYKFFLKSELLDKDSGYSSHYDYPYGEGRKHEEEKEGKEAFINGYNKAEHLSTLLYEFQQREAKKHFFEKKDNDDWLKYWGFGLEEMWQFIVRGNSDTKEKIAKDIEAFNHPVNLMN